jgi:hypothetical protein
MISSSWHLVGRVHFSRAENRRDDEAPFAFLATYTTHVSTQARAQHLPLGRALSEYAGAASKPQLLSLLLPVQRAAAECPWLKTIVESREISPVAVEGRKIARTFWGEAWCDKLERYSDYANRLPRGRTCVRNGSVVDLQVEPGRVTAIVSGSTMYDVRVTVGPVPRSRWSAICKDWSSAIDSLVELLQGRFSKGVMTRLCEEKTGLFPSPKDIVFTCSCPDWASMCKHVAAVLYGIGARLDRQPQLLFKLRNVDQQA